MAIIPWLSRRFVTDERGVTAIEYAIIAALIALGIVAGAEAIGVSLSGTFAGIAAKL